MILRKPYAFLIKKFKIIHLLLTLFAVYLVNRINGILSFYNDFIEGVIGKLGAEDYFGNFYIFIVVLAIISCFTILMLMRYKKKSYLFYMIMIGYFLVSGLLIKYSCDGLYKILFSNLDSKTLLLHRDILKIFSLIQYVFVFMLLVRGLGFDIKKFNFVNDLVELNEDVNDNEEFELTFGGTEDATRKFNRSVREFKYYYLENKFLINVIVLGIVGVFGLFYFLNNVLINPVYKTNDVFQYDSFSFKVLNTYVTNINYDNKFVLDDDNSLVLIKMNVVKNGKEGKINVGKLTLRVDNKGYSNVKVSSKFNDLGYIYNSQIIKDNHNFLFAFKVPNEKLKEDMTLVFGDDKEVRLKPIYLDELEKTINYKIGDKLDLSNSFYECGYLKINSFEIKNSFNYTYTYEVLEQSYEGNITIASYNDTILNLVMESSYCNGMDNYSFLKKYAKLKYVIGDKGYISKVFDDKTPNSYKDGIYLNVDKSLEKADSVWLDITVRNRNYVYKLK